MTLNMEPAPRPWRGFAGRKFIKLFLRICLLFSIIVSWYTSVYAQEDKGQNDPFLSIEDKLKLSQKPVDISKLPYVVILNGIVWTEKIQLAVINNELVKKGHQWRDFQVEEIQKEKVILSLGNSRFEIFLAQEKNNEEAKQ